MLSSWRTAKASLGRQKPKIVDEIYKEYLQHQVSTGEIERSTYSLYSYNKYIKPYLGDYLFATVDKTVLSGWLTKSYQAGLSQNTVHTTYARLKIPPFVNVIFATSIKGCSLYI